MERKKDKKVLKSKTLPPRKTYPAEFDDFDFFSSTDSSTDWEVRIEWFKYHLDQYPSTLLYSLYPNHVQFFLGGGGGGLLGFEHISFFITLHFKLSECLRYFVSKLFFKAPREKNCVWIYKLSKTFHLEIWIW